MLQRRRPANFSTRAWPGYCSLTGVQQRVETWFDHFPQGWYTPDEGGSSDEGKWGQLGYHNWNPQTAMPHGWSMAEFWHLMRESFLFEDGDALVVFGGVNETWLTQFSEIKIVVRGWFWFCLSSGLWFVRGSSDRTSGRRP